MAENHNGRIIQVFLKRHSKANAKSRITLSLFNKFLSDKAE